jgi:hypothetical protein
LLRTGKRNAEAATCPGGCSTPAIKIAVGQSKTAKPKRSGLPKRSRTIGRTAPTAPNSTMRAGLRSSAISNCGLAVQCGAGPVELRKPAEPHVCAGLVPRLYSCRFGSFLEPAGMVQRSGSGPTGARFPWVVNISTPDKQSFSGLQRALSSRSYLRRRSSPAALGGSSIGGRGGSGRGIGIAGGGSVIGGGREGSGGGTGGIPGGGCGIWTLGVHLGTQAFRLRPALLHVPMPRRAARAAPPVRPTVLSRPAWLRWRETAGSGLLRVHGNEENQARS